MLYVTAGLALMFGVLILAGLRAVDQATELVFEARLATAQSLALTLDRDLFHVTSDVQGFGEPLVSASDESTLDQLVSRLMEHLEADSFAFFQPDGIQVVDSVGQVLAAVGLTADVGIPGSGSEALTAGAAEYKVLPSTGTGSATGESTFANLAIRIGSEMSQSWALVHLSPVSSPSSQALDSYVQGGTGGALRTSAEAGDSYHLEVMDPAGNVALALGTDEKVGERSHHFGVISERSSMSEPVVLRHLTERESGVGDHVMGVVPLSDFGFTVVLEQPIDVALALPLRLRRELLLWSAISFVGALAVAWVTTRAVVKPTRQLTLAAERIARGDLDSPIEVTARDEFEILADRFEAMRQRIRDAYEAVEAANEVLEARVAERTAQLGTLLSGVISAQEEERVRLARELHDGTAQTLGALSIALGRAGDASQADSGVSLEQLGKAQEMGGLLLEETRRLILDLRPMLLDDMGLIPAIRWLTGSRLESIGIDCSFEIDLPVERLPPHIETALFRIAQEAINNVAKHSRATRFSFSLSHDGTHLHMVASDNGKGFVFEGPDPGVIDGHVGLAGMQERVGLLGGGISVVSGADQGTIVMVDIPLTDSAERVR